MYILPRSGADSGNFSVPFAAYVMDATTLEAAQEVARLRNWDASALRKGDMTAALRVVGLMLTPALLVVDIDGLSPEAYLSGLGELTSLGIKVIAVGTLSDIDTYRKMIRAGAEEYLVKPITARALGEAVALFDHASGRRGAERKGRVIGVLGARGGVGATTIAVNLAWSTAERLSRATALVDLDIYFGTVAMDLDLPLARGLQEIMRDPETVDRQFLQNAMIKASEHLAVLASEEPLAADDGAESLRDLPIFDTLREMYDVVIGDLPATVSASAPSLLRHFDDLVIVTGLTLASIRDTNRLEALVKQANPQARIWLVANRVGAPSELTDAEIGQTTDLPVAFRIPDVSKTLAAAAIAGKPASQQDTKSVLAETVLSLSKNCLDITEPTKPRGFLARMTGRKT